MIEHAKQDVPRPWWILKTRRWGGSTTVGPFWRIVHWVNLFTQARGNYWAWKQRNS